MEYKKGIAKQILLCVAHLAAFIVIQILVMSFFMVLSPAAMPESQILALVVFDAIYLAFIFLGFAVRKKNSLRELDVKKTNPKLLLLPFLSALLFSFGYDLLAALLVSDSIKTSMENQVQIAFGMGLPMAILGMVVLQPIVEELLFRGIIMRRLSAVIPKKGALIISAFLFGVFHITAGLHLLPVTFVGGLIFGYAYYKSGSLLPAIFAHAGANMAGILSSYWHGSAGASVFMGILSFLFSAAILYVFAKSNTKKRVSSGAKL